MNFITVSTSRTKEFENEALRNQHNSVIVGNSKEAWRIFVNCQQEDGCTDRELSLIRIALPNGKTITGTIQELQNMEYMLKNALKLLKAYSWEIVDKSSEDDISTSITELESLLSLFK